MENQSRSKSRPFGFVLSFRTDIFCYGADLPPTNSTEGSGADVCNGRTQNQYAVESNSSSGTIQVQGLD